MEKLLLGLITVLLAIATFVIIDVLMAFPVMWLWNYVVPPLFGLTTITFWQAFCLNLLCSILFKNSSSSKSK